MENVLVAIVGGISAVVAAAITAWVMVRAQIVRVQKDNALLYLWNRDLVDHIFKGLGPPPPSPPPGLFKE